MLAEEHGIEAFTARRVLSPAVGHLLESHGGGVPAFGGQLGLLPGGATT